MNVLICGRTKAVNYAYKYTNRGFSVAVISISDINKTNPIFPSNVSTLKLQFDDVENNEDGCISSSDAKNICNYVNIIKDKYDILIVHCEAGISRSAGVAAAIMKYLNNDDSKVFNCPLYCPNMTCYRFVLNEFYQYVNEDEIIKKEKRNMALWMRKNIKLFQGILS